MDSRLAFAFACLAAAVPALAQDPPDPRKLFESGKYQEVIERTQGDAPPEVLYLRALAFQKIDQNDQAKAVYGQLAGGDGGDAWTHIGASAVALIEGNAEGAAAEAAKAVSLNGGLPQAHYQLGLVQAARDQHNPASVAFAKAAELDSQMAYAHYHAGMSFYRAKRVDRMAIYFENFIKLAPEAPERPAVESILRTLRGR